MKIGYKSSALLLILLAVRYDCHATVIYVRFTPHEIVIGADSKRTVETGATVCVCKISQIGDTFVVSAGLAEYGDFDPRAFAKQAINSSRSLEEVRTKFEQLINEPLIEVLNKLRTRNRARYDTFKKGAAVNMIFARFDNLPELVASVLTPRDDSDGSIVLESAPIKLTDVQKSKRIFVGLSKRVEMQLDRSGLWSRGTVAGVRRLLEMSIQDNPDAGGPIDILRLTKGAAQWYPQKPECDGKAHRISERPSSCNTGIPGL